METGWLRVRQQVGNNHNCCAPLTLSLGHVDRGAYAQHEGGTVRTNHITGLHVDRSDWPSVQLFSVLCLYCTPLLPWTVCLYVINVGRCTHFGG
jgi:hypothetical protein